MSSSLFLLNKNVNTFLLYSTLSKINYNGPKKNRRWYLLVMMYTHEPVHYQRGKKLYKHSRHDAHIVCGYAVHPFFIIILNAKHNEKKNFIIDR